MKQIGRKCLFISNPITAKIFDLNTNTKKDLTFHCAFLLHLSASSIVSLLSCCVHLPHHVNLGVFFFLCTQHCIFSIFIIHASNEVGDCGNVRLLPQRQTPPLSETDTVRSLKVPCNPLYYFWLHSDSTRICYHCCNMRVFLSPLVLAFCS